MPKTIAYELIRDMWNESTNEQRNELKQAWIDRYQRRIDIQDVNTMDCINKVIETTKPTTHQIFMLYIAAISDTPEDWFFTTKQVYWSPRKKIYTGQ